MTNTEYEPTDVTEQDYEIGRYRRLLADHLDQAEVATRAAIGDQAGLRRYDDVELVEGVEDGDLAFHLETAARHLRAAERIATDLKGRS